MLLLIVGAANTQEPLLNEINGKLDTIIHLLLNVPTQNDKQYVYEFN
jgi:hypothetical protein